MKRKLFTLLILLTIASVSAQNYYMAAPEGFGRATTGGGTPTTANTVTVSNYNELTSALTSTDPSKSVILVSGTIDFPKLFKVKLTNKTIIGLPGAKFRNIQISVGDSPTSRANSGILYIQKLSDNVIIRNLIFEGPGAYDVDGEDNLTNEGTNVWVDHCEFQDGIDGNFDIKGAADNTTVSWCKFTYLKPAIAGGSGGSNDHRFSDLIGSGTTDMPADGRFSVTLQNCYWAEGCKERMPRARNAELHLLNCYYKTSVSGAKAIGLGAGNSGSTCYVENCNFEQIATISSPVNEGTGTASLFFDNCTKGTTPIPVTDLNYGTASKPTYNYTSLPVSEVANAVSNTSCGAGATLQVSATGVISTSCPDLGTNAIVKGDDFKFYPTVVTDQVTIEMANLENEKATITIYNTNGSKIYTTTSTFENNIETINLATLAKGIYFCKIVIGTKTNSIKFIKN